jgi:hypothetical protein
MILISLEMALLRISEISLYLSVQTWCPLTLKGNKALIFFHLNAFSDDSVHITPEYTDCDVTDLNADFFMESTSHKKLNEYTNYCSATIQRFQPENLLLSVEPSS